jgi:T3SS negative regulator,GrlR
MQDGIYHVRFSSSVGSSGEGLVVIKQGSVNGGDGGYLYIGQLIASGGTLSGRLNIKRWNAS